MALRAGYKGIKNKYADVINRGEGGPGGNTSGFIDVSNLIYSDANVLSSLSFTTTDDCVVVLHLIPASGQGFNGSVISINDVNITTAYVQPGMTAGFPFSISLKKGDTISASSLNAQYPSSIKAFGLK